MSESDDDKDISQDLILDTKIVTPTSKIEGVDSMEENLGQLSALALKTDRRSKINLALIVIGLSTLGYLQYNSSASQESTVAEIKTTLDKEIAAKIEASSTESLQPQIQAVVEKNAELEVKVNGYESQIANLEIRLSQFQVDLEKNTNLRNRISELESRMKSGPSKAKSTSPKSSKTPASKKGTKKGKKK